MALLFSVNIIAVSAVVGYSVSYGIVRGIVWGIWYSDNRATPDINAVIYSVVRLSGLSGAVILCVVTALIIPALIIPALIIPALIIPALIIPALIIPALIIPALFCAIYSGITARHDPRHHTPPLNRKTLLF